MSGAGQAQSGLALLAGGMRLVPAEVVHFRRPDVMRHLGLSNDNCGFRARFVLASADAEIGPDLQVLAGDSAERAHSPLRIAATVLDQLREHAQPVPAPDRSGA